MSDDHPRRPNDHHVEPLFAGLGHGEQAPTRPERRGALLRNLLLLLSAGAATALVLWWLE